MANLYFQALKPDLIFFVQTASTPTDEEWSVAVQHAEHSPPDVSWRCLVITDGGAPTLRQRKLLDDKLKGKTGGRTAIVTDSAATRALLTAVAWVSQNKLKTFPYAELHKALAYLDCNAAEQGLIEEATAKAARALDTRILRPPLRVAR